MFVVDMIRTRKIVRRCNKTYLFEYTFHCLIALHGAQLLRHTEAMRVEIKGNYLHCMKGIEKGRRSEKGPTRKKSM